MVLTWNYSAASISGVTPYPLQLTYSVFNDGSIWFLDNNRRIWLGNQLGQWLGFAEFPYGAHPDLSYSKFIVQSSSGLKIVCLNKYGETLMVYDADVSHFLRP